MLIDCDSCTVRGSACSGCMVSTLLGGEPELDEATAQAVQALIDGGLMPGPQQVVRVSGDDEHTREHTHGDDRAPWPVDLPTPSRRRWAG